MTTTGTRQDFATTAANEPTVILECDCNHCETYADKNGLPFPIRFEMVERTAKALAPNAQGRHIQAKKAHQPMFGRYDNTQAQFGPWKA